MMKMVSIRNADWIPFETRVATGLKGDAYIYMLYQKPVPLISQVRSDSNTDLGLVTLAALAIHPFDDATAPAQL